VIFLLGYQENPVDDKFDPPGSQTVNKRRALPVIRRYTQPEQVDEAFEALRRYWNGLLDRFQVESPVILQPTAWSTSRTPYQCMITFNMSRSASYFEIRNRPPAWDSAIPQDPAGIRAHGANAPGSASSTWPPRTCLPAGLTTSTAATKRGNNDVGSNFNETRLAGIGVSAYLKETGDWSILEEQVLTDNQPGTETPLYEHLQRCIRYTLERIGPHGCA